MSCIRVFEKIPDHSEGASAPSTSEKVGRPLTSTDLRKDTPSPSSNDGIQAAKVCFYLCPPQNLSLNQFNQRP
jgi:hypothetical protein